MILRPGETERDERTIANTPEALRALIRRNSFEHPVARYEAGPNGYETHRFLTWLDVPWDVVAPTMTPRRAGAELFAAFASPIIGVADALLGWRGSLRMRTEARERSLAYRIGWLFCRPFRLPNPDHLWPGFYGSSGHQIALPTIGNENSSSPGRVAI